MVGLVTLCQKLLHPDPQLLVFTDPKKEGSMTYETYNL